MSSLKNIWQYYWIRFTASAEHDADLGEVSATTVVMAAATPPDSTARLMGAPMSTVPVSDVYRTVTRVVPALAGVSCAW